MLSGFNFSICVKDVSNDKIKKIIEAGMRAPSSKNCQPWHFIVLKGKEKNKLVDIAKKAYRGESEWVTKGTISFKKSDVYTKRKDFDINGKTTFFVSCNTIKSAPVLILVFNKHPLSGGENKAAKDTRLISAVITETLSIGACNENMLLAAKSLGLGSLWMGDLRCTASAIKKYFKINYDLIASIAIGYAKYKIPPRMIPKFKLRILK